MKNIKFYIGAILITTFGCNHNEDKADAYGNFEAIDVLVSAEAAGRILNFLPLEGESLQKGHVTVHIDSTQQHLKKKQLQSGLATLRSKINTLDAQVRASRVQLKNLEREKERIDNLVEGGAATSKQRDDIEGQIAFLEAQIAAAESQKTSVYSERNTLDVQIQQVEDLIWKSEIRNPIDGVLLNKYKEQGEMAIPGQPLFKMANMDELILRAYVSGEQLSEVKVGGSVRVHFDKAGEMGEVSGVVSWVSPRAEFTPKIIQTRQERVNLVYAIKVVVPNDGSLKIGMPGEVNF